MILYSYVMLVLMVVMLVFLYIIFKAVLVSGSLFYSCVLLANIFLLETDVRILQRYPPSQKKDECSCNFSNTIRTLIMNAF